MSEYQEISAEEAYRRVRSPLAEAAGWPAVTNEQAMSYVENNLELGVKMTGRMVSDCPVEVYWTYAAEADTRLCHVRYEKEGELRVVGESLPGFSGGKESNPEDDERVRKLLDVVKADLAGAT